MDDRHRRRQPDARRLGAPVTGRGAQRLSRSKCRRTCQRRHHRCPGRGGRTRRYCILWHRAGRDHRGRPRHGDDADHAHCHNQGQVQRSRRARRPAAALPTATATVPATATPAATATPSATATPAATATPEKQYTLDVVQWTQNANGEEIAVVRDANGTLWYVWGPDVDRIERGLDPQYQPQPVNATEPLARLLNQGAGHPCTHRQPGERKA